MNDMTDVVPFIIAIEIAAVIWFLLDAASQWVSGVLSIGRDRSLAWGSARTAAANVVIDPLLQAYSSATWLAGLSLTNWALAILCVAFAIVGVVASDHGPVVIEALDSAWEHAFWPVVAPVKEVLNIVRLVLDSLIGVYNSVGGVLGSPLLAAAQTFVNCSSPHVVGGRHFYQNFVDVGNSMTGAMGATFNFIDDPDPLTADFATQPITAPLRRIADDVVSRMECACGLDHGILYVPLHVMLATNGSLLDDAVFHGEKLFACAALRQKLNQKRCAPAN